MMDKETLRAERARLIEEKATLEAKLSTAEGPERRKLRVNIALVEEQILDCRDRLRRLRAAEQREREKADRTAAQKRKAVRRQAAAREDACFLELLGRLTGENKPKADHAGLSELAKSYRMQADVLRHRIQLVHEIRPKTVEEAYALAERLRILEAMRRDVRDIAVICERYYDTSYRRNERYTL